MSELPPITDNSAAEGSLSYLRYWKQKKAEVEEHTEKQINEALKWNDRQLQRINAKIQFHEDRLREYMEVAHLKKLDLINGYVRIRSGRPALILKDRDAFIRWIEEDHDRLDLVEITPHPIKSGIVKYIKRTGEIPPGVEWEPGPDRLAIRLTAETEEKEDESDDEDQEPYLGSEEGSEPGSEALEVEGGSV